MIKSVNAQIKNKYLYFTALIGLGFLWTGSAYIVQAYRLLPFCASVVALICTAASLFAPSLAVIITTGALLNIAIGLLSGCYLTRLATDIPQQRRGLLFGGAYAFGSIGTWLLSLPMGGVSCGTEVASSL